MDRAAARMPGSAGVRRRPQRPPRFSPRASQPPSAGSKPSASSSSRRRRGRAGSNTRARGRSPGARPRRIWVVGDERLVRTRPDEQLVAQTLGVGEAEPVASRSPYALAGQPLGPEVERLHRGHPPADLVDHPVAGAPGAAPGYSKKVMSEPGLPLLVGVEEVVDGRVVLVDRLLHQAQTQHARVEVDVAPGVAGDGSDVVDALEFDATEPTRLVGLPARRSVPGARRLTGGDNRWRDRRLGRPATSGRPEADEPPHSRSARPTRTGRSTRALSRSWWRRSTPLRRATSRCASPSAARA